MALRQTRAISIPLNATGRKLRARFMTVPATVTVTLTSAGRKSGLSCRVGGDLPVRELDLDAGAAEVDHGDQRVG